VEDSRRHWLQMSFHRWQRFSLRREERQPTRRKYQHICNSGSGKEVHYHCSYPVKVDHSYK